MRIIRVKVVTTLVASSVAYLPKSDEDNYLFKIHSLRLINLIHALALLLTPSNSS